MLYQDGENWTQINATENNGTLRFCDGQLTWGACKAEIRIFDIYDGYAIRYLIETNGSDVYDIRAYISQENLVPDENDTVILGWPDDDGYYMYKTQEELYLNPSLITNTNYYIRLRVESNLGISYSDVVQYTYTGLDVDNDNDGYSENQGDCDDDNVQVNPGATEIEDGVDNDCDGDIDEGFNESGTVTDQDGNTYDYLTYGNQVWTVENAEMVTYRDGTPIPEVTDPTQWSNLTTGAWSYYNNDPTKPRLYNWYAVMGIHDAASLSDISLRKEFAPEGWHVPSDMEWTTIEEHLIANGYNYDGTTTENKIAKAMASTTGWGFNTTAGAIGNDQSANNSSGFNALPEGFRNNNGSFYGGSVIFWSSTQTNPNYAWNRYLNYNRSNLLMTTVNKRDGLAVRFVRD